MKKLLESKTVLLLLGCISLLGLIILVASLSRIQFAPGSPFQYLSAPSVGAAPQSISPFPLYCVIVVVALALIVLFIFLSPRERKRLLRGVAIFLLIGVGLLWILSATRTGEPGALPAEEAGLPLLTRQPEATDTPAAQVVPAVFTPPEVASWESYLVTLGVLAVVGVGAWWFSIRRRKGSGLPSALVEIARSALEELEEGKDWGDAVINCYHRMTRAVEDWRGIRRRSGMTPEEFAEFLVGFGLPPQAVYDLTRLFERVRYGRRKTTQKDIHAAVVCLNAIVDACKELG